jgi:prophage antirepressor-like protein
MLGLQIFHNDQFNVRVQSIDGVPYFSLFDVCKSVGIKDSIEVATQLDADGIIVGECGDGIGCQRSFFYVNELNLIKTIFMVRNKEAEAFLEWMTEGVLPCIRKDSGYIAQAFAKEAIRDPQSAIRLLEKIEKDSENPRKIIPQQDVVSIGEVAKMLGWGRTRLFKRLQTMGIFTKAGLPLKKYVDKKFFQVLKQGTGIHSSIAVTPKGQVYLSEMLAS